MKSIMILRHTHVTVTRMDNESLRIEAIVNGSDVEAFFGMIVNSSTFEINDNKWEIVRDEARDVFNSKGRADSLIGIKAFLGIEKALRKISLPEIILGLTKECVKGAIQTQAHVLEDLNLTNEELDDFWETNYFGKCAFYSQLDKVQTTWSQYAKAGTREDLLFTRDKQVSVRSEGKIVSISGSFTDSYHEVIANAVVDTTTNKLIDVNAFLLRCPDLVCHKSLGREQGLIGKEINDMTKSSLANIVGGSYGCFHIVDIFFEMLLETKGLLRGNIG